MGMGLFQHIYLLGSHTRRNVSVLVDTPQLISFNTLFYADNLRTQYTYLSPPNRAKLGG